MVGGLTQQLADAVEVAGQRAREQQAQARDQENQAQRQEFESRVANALDMAGDEAEVIDVIERTFRATLPNSPVELLLADNSRAHLTRMASTSPSGTAPGCSVDSPDHLPGRTSSADTAFSRTATDIDSCPKLRGRIAPVSSVCLPVSIMGR